MKSISRQGVYNPALEPNLLHQGWRPIQLGYIIPELVGFVKADEFLNECDVGVVALNLLNLGGTQARKLARASARILLLHRVDELASHPRSLIRLPPHCKLTQNQNLNVIEVSAGHHLERALAGDVRAGEHADGAEHGQAAVVELLGLVALPALVRLPLRRAEEVARLVVWPPAVEDADHLHEHDEGEDLQPAELRHLRQREQRVGRVLAAEERVEAVGARGAVRPSMPVGTRDVTGVSAANARAREGTHAHVVGRVTRRLVQHGLEMSRALSTFRKGMSVVNAIERMQASAEPTLSTPSPLGPSRLSGLSSRALATSPTG